MTEPVIKPKAFWCPECQGTPGDWHFQHALEVELQPLYGPDALVHVAMALLIPFSPLERLQETSEAVVKKLTEGTS